MQSLYPATYSKYYTCNTHLRVWVEIISRYIANKLLYRCVVPLDDLGDPGVDVAEGGFDDVLGDSPQAGNPDVDVAL